MIKMLQYKMYPAGELRCPTTALVSPIYLMYQAMKIGSVAGSIPAELITFFVEIGHKVISLVTPLPLMSVIDTRMCTSTGYRLEDSACLGKVWLGKLTSST